MVTNVNRLVDTNTIWKCQLDTQIPAEVRNVLNSGYTFLKVPVPIIGPSGRTYQTVLDKKGNGKYERGSYVIFEIKKGPENKGDKPTGKIKKEISKEEYNEEEKKSTHRRLSELIDEIEHALKRFEKERDAKIESELENQREELQRKVEEAEEERKAFIEKQYRLEETVQEKAEKKTEDLKETYEELLSDLNEREESLNQRESRIANLEEEVEWFRQKGGPEFMQILRSATEDEEVRESRSAPEHTSVPPTFWQDLLSALKKSGYRLPNDITFLQFVLSATVAAATGQFVVMSGPTGVGKTSLVKKMRRGLGIGPVGERSGVIPVRPAWIDSTDLLGFYNPAEDVFEPTPFMDELVEARRYGDAGELYYLVLDEMNLSRVENYGADFLAKMEKARKMDSEENADAKLRLYAESIADRKRRKIKGIIDNGDEEEKKEKLADLRQQVERYPARFPIPDGLVLFGTINADETTHSFSPKFKDRAFIIQLPAATLPEDLPSNRENQPMERVWTLTQQFIQGINPQQEFSDEISKVWEHIVDWNDKYLQPMEIHLSHRLERLFRYYFATAQAFGITPSDGNGAGYTLNNVASAFALSRILPWISFHRDEKATSENWEDKKDVLEGWAKDDSLEEYPALKEAIEDIRDSGQLTYEYMGS